MELYIILTASEYPFIFLLNEIIREYAVFYLI